MIKKALVIVAILVTLTQSVFSLSVEQMADKLVEKLNINKELTTDVIRHYKDWRYVDNYYKISVATAIREGILLPNNGIISPKSENISTIIKGLTYYGIKNSNYNIVSSAYKMQNIGGAKVNLDTMVIIGNEFGNMALLIEGEYYNAIVDKNNNAIIVWRQNGVKIPTLLRGSLFFKEGNKLILTSLEKANFDSWTNVANQKYIDVELGLGVMVIQKGRIVSDDELSSNFLDGLVYILADYNDNTVKPLYVEVSN